MLICEKLVSIPPDPYGVMIDMCIMDVGSRERSEEEFRVLIEASGLKVIRIYLKEGTSISVIECAKAN